MVLIITYSVPCNVMIYMWSSLFLLLLLGCEFLKLIVSKPAIVHLRALIG